LARFSRADGAQDKIPRKINIMPKETAKSSKPAAKAKSPAKATAKAPVKAAPKKAGAKPRVENPAPKGKKAVPAKAPSAPPAKAVAKPKPGAKDGVKAAPARVKEAAANIKQEKPAIAAPSAPAKPAQKPATKGSETKGRKGRSLPPELALPQAPVDIETKRTRLKTLIALGKERGFLTYAEINDHLPDDLVDAEQIEGVISMIGDMGIQVFDQAPDADTLLMAEAAPAAPTEDVEEEAEAAASTLDSEFGRTTDPVRMYMREMGSVELLTREGEIEIAKRIEDGLKHMIMAISACPMTVGQILELADKIAHEVDGTSYSLVTETLFNIPTTAHILGGCCMGDSAATGVIDHRHLVFGYEGLFVIDGSSISANPGVNPSLTITALAERAMSLIPPREASA